MKVGRSAEGIVCPILPSLGLDFCRVGTGLFRLPSEQIWKLIVMNKKFLCRVIGPISKPNDYLNTVFYDVVSLHMELQTPPPLGSPQEKLHLVVILSPCVWNVFPYNKGIDSVYAICRSLHRVVTKISSCQVNTTTRRGIKPLRISFGSIFLLFSNKSSRGPLS